MRKLLITLFLLLFIPTLCFGAAGGYGATCLTGGTTGCVDAIDGDELADGDKLKAQVSGVAYFYNLNGSSSCTEGSVIANVTPIKPDTNPGTKCWELEKVRGIDFQATTGAAINEFSTDGTLAGNSDTAVPTEKAVKTYSDTKTEDSDLPGFLIRSKQIWKDADEIYLDPAVYHHAGTTEQFVYWDAQITFQFGSSGSNALSDDLGASEWHYIYIDDSAVVTAGTAVISASELLNDTTAPSWDATDHAWMNGDDRCIGAALTDGSNNVLEFIHDADFVLYADQIEDRAAATVSNDWSDEVTLTIPAFARKANVHFFFNSNNDTSSRICSWRTEGQTGSTGHRAVWADADNVSRQETTFNVIASSNLKIDVKIDGAGADDHQLTVNTNGWDYPIGM